MTDYDAIVLGLGGMGSAAAAQLADRGARVLGVEQYGPAHDLGSSHGETRIVRQAYFEHPDYVPLLRRAYVHWERLAAARGAPLFVRTGALMIGAEDSAVVSGTLESARRWDLPHEVLDQAAMAKRYPQFALRTGECGVYEDNAGYVNPEQAVQTQLDLATRAGAELWFDTVVDGWSLDGDVVSVRAGGQSVTAARLVLTAGAWTSKLVTAGLLPLRAVRRLMFFLDPPDGLADFEPDRFPVYVFETGTGDALYGFPHIGAPDAGVKIGFHYRGPDVDPDVIDRAVSEAEKAEMQAAVRERIPGLDGPVVDARVCMYTMTPDEDFILGWLSGAERRVAVAAGFSGHGFKFTPVVGEVLADLALDGRTDQPIDFLSPARFDLRGSG
ncbi:MAG: N-methyl-L-tryptophan oxidase [Jatrophihabitans sp.]